MSATMARASAAARDGDAAFFAGLSDGDWERLVRATDEDGRSLLHSAVAGGHVELVQTLLQRGGAALVNHSDEDGWTPLISASSVGSEQVVRLLLSHKASTLSPTSGGRTPLHYAASKGHSGVIPLLIEAGADVNAGDVTGATPLHRACSALKQHAASALVGAGARLAVQDCEGNTPLHCAVEAAVDRASARTAFLLAAHGAPLDVRNRAELTPLDLAGPNADALREAAARGPGGWQEDDVSMEDLSGP